MIPSDHYVRFYNEVFKALEAMGRDHLLDYWREIGRKKIKDYGDVFREKGLPAAYEYWSRIVVEENCQAELTLDDDYLEFRMDRCPSLTKVLDNDASPCECYCDHCMGWIQPFMDAVGLYPVMDMKSRTEPHCLFRVYQDKDNAEAFAAEAKLLSRPYD